MDEPSAEVIKKLKEQFSDRSLQQVEFGEGDEAFCFVMTGPNAVEYKKFVDETVDASDAKSEKDKIEKVRAAAEKAAMAQIRWPDRDQVKQLFDRYPAMITKFVDVLQTAAGDSFEVRTKKL